MPETPAFRFAGNPRYSPDDGPADRSEATVPIGTITRSCTDEPACLVPSFLIPPSLRAFVPRSSFQKIFSHFPLTKNFFLLFFNFMKQLVASWERRELELGLVPDSQLAPFDKQRVLTALNALAAGSTLNDIAVSGGMMKGEIGLVCSMSPIIKSLFDQARVIRDYSRQLEREDKAHERAVDGVTKEVFDNRGNIISTQREYSDDLIKFLMKATEPEKYSDKSSLSVQSGVVLQVNMGLRDQPTIEVTDDDEDNQKARSRGTSAPVSYPAPKLRGENPVELDPNGAPAGPGG